MKVVTFDGIATTAECSGGQISIAISWPSPLLLLQFVLLSTILVIRWNNKIRHRVLLLIWINDDDD